MSGPTLNDRQIKDYFFKSDLALSDPEVSRLIDLEDERQLRKIILIASESICPIAVRQALATSFSNLYGEGYPSTRMSRSVEKPLMELDHHLSFFRRYSDRRYYKGCDYINAVESLCQQRAAALFATDRFDGIGPKVPASDIFANRGRGEQRRLQRLREARRDRHGASPLGGRPPDPREPGEPVGHELQHRPLHG